MNNKEKKVPSLVLKVDDSGNVYARRWKSTERIKVGDLNTEINEKELFSLLEKWSINNSPQDVLF